MREELTRADTKASLFLAALGVVIGALLAALLSSDWSPAELNNSVEWLWWLGILCCAGAVVLLATAIYPRTKRQLKATGSNSAKIGPSFYYGDIEKLSSQELQKAISDISEETAIIDQLISISQIVGYKYRALRRGLLLLCVSAAFVLVAVVGNLALA
jgi:Pycsar effector protein